MHETVKRQLESIITVMDTILTGIEDSELSLEAYRTIHNYKRLKNSLVSLQPEDFESLNIYDTARAIVSATQLISHALRKELSLSEKTLAQIKVLDNKGQKLNENLKSTKVKYGRRESEEEKAYNSFGEERPKQSNYEENLETTASLKNSIELIYSEVVEDVEKKRNEINELLGQATEGSLSKSYEDEAKRELESANWLRVLSFFCMGLMAIAAFSLMLKGESQYQLSDYLYRFAILLTLSIPATYAAKESSKHRESGKEHLQTALDIKSITPFISSLPAEQQNKIRGQIAEQIFSPLTRPAIVQSIEGGNGNVLKDIAGIVKEIKKGIQER